MNMKKYEDAMKRMADNPTEQELEGMTIFGLPAKKFTKRDLLCVILFLLKKEKKDMEEHHRQLDFITSLRR